MDSPKLQDEELQRQIAEAKEQAVVYCSVEPRAESAEYDRTSGNVVIHLQHGAMFSFPAGLGQGLTGASPEELAEVEVTSSGTGLHWETLDADLSVPALLNGIYGNAAWMANMRSMAPQQ